MIVKFNTLKTKKIDRIDRILSLFYKKPQNMHSIELSRVENIVVVEFALIGDIVMDIPFLRIIKNNCPRAKITMVCEVWAETILKNQNLVDEFVIFDGKNKLSNPIKMIKNLKDIFRTIKKLNRKRYQIGIEPKGDLRYILFLHYILCDRTITYNYTGGDYLVTDCFAPLAETEHLIDEKIDLLNMAGFNTEDAILVPTLRVDKGWRKRLDIYIHDNDLLDKVIIGIHPGSSNKNKQYPCFPEAVESICEKYDQKYCFAVFEGPEDKNYADSVCKRLPKERYFRVNKTLEEYINIVSICDYMICNDSSAGHIAAAFGIPVLVIFGAVDAKTSAPRGNSKVSVISKKLDCKPCTLPICPFDTYECLQTISSVEVVDKFVELIDG